MGKINQEQERPAGLTQPEAAKRLGISVRTLQRLTHQGRLTPTYQQGRTRPVPVFQREAVEVLRGEICNRPLSKQAKGRAGEHTNKKPFGFRAAPEEIQRLREEASRFGMRPSEYARHLVQLGLESGFRKETDHLSREVASLHTEITDLKRTLQKQREEFTEVIEIVLEVAGMPSRDAKAWVDENLRVEASHQDAQRKRR